MPTTKKRLNLTLPPDIEKAIRLLAKRDNTSEAGKAVEMIKMSLELEEDRLLSLIAEERDTPDAQFISHEDIWK